MSNIVHTAGDWFMSEEPGGCNDCIRQEETGRLICEFPYGFDGEDGTNARLISAAPELLDKLSSVADALDRMAFAFFDVEHNGMDGSGDHAETYRRALVEVKAAKALLNRARATGETP